MNTKIIYWPKGGNVENVAIKMREKIAGAKAYCVDELDFNMIAKNDMLILGGSTVGADDWKNTDYPDAWAMFYGELKSKGLTLEGKKVAIYGLGNQVLYPSHFVDDIKRMAEAVKDTGAELVGAFKNEGYHFDASEALEDGYFMGLPLDEDTQADKTDARIDKWLKSLGL